MKKYQLSIDPRILELLGPSLYTNIYYVLAELIANAYDADAKNVYIIVNKDDIRVEDDGRGMSYEAGDILKYLDVASVSRKTKKESLTKAGRLKMGRKGIGKLAALSVSKNVDVLTVADDEKSGFTLSRKIEDDRKLKAILDHNIKFKYVTTHGSAIIMRDPQYHLHKTLSVAKKNILKIFPLVNSDFQIHLIRDNESEVLGEFDKNIMGDLSTLISIGDKFAYLCELVPDLYLRKRSELVVARATKTIPLTMKNIQGNEKKYPLKIEGWIGTYKTTRGRKVKMTDFPDNFISLFANEKMGEFNILPAVGQNKLNEVYIVGQLHINLFELTELPDMALSNRQGYKTDDPRYKAVLDYVRNKLLAEILKKRESFADLSKEKEKKKKLEDQQENEKKLKQNIDNFRKKTSESALKNINDLGQERSPKAIEIAVAKAISENSPDLGLKAIVDSQKKTILISQASRDKPFSDIVYQMLLHNNVPSDDILYTSCDDEVCRMPSGINVYDYLRDFFVKSYSTQKIFVLFITSENTKASWGAIIEIGASWITKIDHEIFNIHPFHPKPPLNSEHQWQNTNREEPTKGDLWIISPNADIFCQKIEAICDTLAYDKKTRKENMTYLETLVSVKDR